MKKKFDSVEMMRKIRNQIGSEIKQMSFEDQKNYIQKRLNREVSKSHNSMQNK
jgi:hypothetical protein